MLPGAWVEQTWVSVVFEEGEKRRGREGERERGRGGGRRSGGWVRMSPCVRRERGSGQKGREKKKKKIELRQTREKEIERTYRTVPEDRD